MPETTAKRGFSERGPLSCVTVNPNINNGLKCLTLQQPSIETIGLLRPVSNAVSVFAKGNPSQPFVTFNGDDEAYGKGAKP